MGKTTFEDDPDVQALRASMRPAAGSLRWGKILTALLIVGWGTFLLGYHLPLQRAHLALNERFTQLQSQLTESSRTLDEARKQTRELTEKQQSLESQLAETQRAEKSGESAGRAMRAALEPKLQKLVEKNQAAVGVAGTQTVTSVSLGHVLTPGKVDVSPPGKATLCTIAGASAEKPIRVVAVADKKSIPAALAAKLKTPLQLSLAVAQSVTETLIAKCNVAPGRLTAVGVPGEPTAPAKFDGKKLTGPRVELWLD